MPHLLAYHDVILQVLLELWSILLIEQEFLLLLWQRGHDIIRWQEDCHWMENHIVYRVHHSCVLKHTGDKVRWIFGFLKPSGPLAKYPQIKSKEWSSKTLGHITSYSLMQTNEMF